MKPLDKLLTRFGSDVDINLELSINFILHDIFVALSLSYLSLFIISFLIDTEKVMYFSVFSPKHSNSPSNYSANSLIIK